MSGNASGLQVEQMQDLSRRFIRAGQQFQQSKTIVNGAVMETWWAGPDAARFQAIWNSTLMPRLVRTAQELMELADKIRQEIDTQLRASAAGGDGLTARGTATPGGTGSGGRLFDQWIKKIGELVGLADKLATGVGALARVIDASIVKVAGYVTKAGTVVDDYVRWAKGSATMLNDLLGKASSVRSVLKTFTQVADVIGAVDVGLSTLLGGFDQWNKDVGLETGERASRATAVAIAHGAESLAVSWAAGEAGLAAGAAIGTFVGGPVGTVVGAGAGFVIGAGSALLLTEGTDFLNNYIDPVVADVGGAIWNGANDAIDAVAPVIETGKQVIGDAISSGANLIESGWKSIF